MNSNVAISVYFPPFPLGRKGGELASAVHAYTKTGDPYMKSLVQHILSLVSHPVLSFLYRWIYDGELEDTYHEVSMGAWGYGAWLPPLQCAFLSHYLRSEPHCARTPVSVLGVSGLMAQGGRLFWGLATQPRAAVFLHGCFINLVPRCC